MTIDTSPEALAKMRERCAIGYGASTQESLALCDALDEARAKVYRDSEAMDIIHRAAELVDDTPVVVLARQLEAAKAACRSAGVCMSCLFGSPDPIGCVDCLGTGFDGGDPREQIKTLEAQLEEAKATLYQAEGDLGMVYDEAIARVTAAIAALEGKAAP